jgi:hypothetical protein
LLFFGTPFTVISEIDDRKILINPRTISLEILELAQFIGASSIPLSHHTGLHHLKL